MKIKLLCALLSGFLVIGAARAETIYLNDGRVIKGKIINRGAYDVTIKEGVMPRKFFNDQILRIEPDVAPVNDAAGATGAVDSSGLTGISAEKAALITEFIEASGIRQSMQANTERIIAQSPVEKQAELRTIFDINGIIRQIVPIYDKYYSPEELREIIAFYKTPAGQKMIEVTPKIMSEFLQASVDAIKQRSQP
ncbi:MAG TPA: hypothetical protein DE315_03625 [Candidatus Omnitrophica bacterium]|nr:hypothetical protein [Candidatus Omnitrophota bacterium]HCI44605.1 hypothetical protein [Candidatus Omnitrophota bacterium]